MKTVLSSILFIPLLAFGQIDEVTNLLIEAQAEQEADLGEGLLVEDLSTLMSQPLDLNTANYTDLTALTVLSYEQINQLLQHREIYGLFQDMEELQLIQGFDSSTVRKISKYVCIKPRISWKNANSIDSKHVSTFLFKTGRILEKSEGYNTSNTSVEPHYSGDPNSVYAGFRHRYLDKISLGILGEKDPGESFFRGGQKNGFDFYSAHLSLNISQVVRSVIIGDYQVHFGQGLCLSSNALGGKSSDVLLVEKTSKSIRPNFSVNESVFLRGLATELEFERFRLTGFYSVRKHDASENKNGSLSSIYTSGLHRNENEQNKKNRLTTQLTGVDIGMKNKYFRPGLSLVRQEMSHSLKSNSALYNLVHESNRIILNTAFHYNFDVRNIHFFGEIARSISHGSAMITGAVFNVDPKVHLSISYRNYSPTYTTAYSSAFSENSTTSNEKGLFASMMFRFNRKVTWSIYIDFFRFPWLKYQVNAPSWGMDRLSDINFSFSRKMQLSLRIRLREKQQNADSENRVIPSTTMVSKFQLRSQFTYQLHENIRLRSRVEFVVIQNDGLSEKGFLSFHEVKFKQKKTPISLLVRMSFFDTDGYSSRIYAYEQDLPGSYSIPAHYGLGSRFVLLTSYKVNHFLRLYVKFAQSIFEDQMYIGNAWDRINGPVKSEIKFMCKMDF